MSLAFKMPRGKLPKGQQIVGEGYWLKDTYSHRISNRRKEIETEAEHKERVEKTGEFHIFIEAFLLALEAQVAKSRKPIRPIPIGNIRMRSDSPRTTGVEGFNPGGEEPSVKREPVFSIGDVGGGNYALKEKLEALGF